MSFDTDQLEFLGGRGDPNRLLSRGQLIERLGQLPPVPKDRGTVIVLCGRGPSGQRNAHRQALLTIDGGMPDDRWNFPQRYGDDQPFPVRTQATKAMCDPAHCQ